MFLKSILIEGFKSYGQRVTVGDFDPTFNAITGLNGSGKSNILDAICFVMGINLQNVRASSLQELVYKSGQAGINRASVSLTFDNTNRELSPEGYQNFDYITVTRIAVVGGKNKYLLNGINVPLNRVTDFFKSVQLNVHNPHFLIQQGRISTVVNMKPKAVLAMLEEAIGTSLYEDKRTSCQKTIEKKNSKLVEIQTLINEEIGPNVNRLMKDRQKSLEYETAKRKYEIAFRKYVCYQYVACEEKAQSSGKVLEESKRKLHELNEKIQSGDSRITEITEKVNTLEKERDKEFGGKLSEYESQLREKEQAQIKAENHLKSVKASKVQEEKNFTKTKKSMDMDQKALEDKTKESNGMQGLYDKLREEVNKCTEALTSAERRYEAISTGRFMTEGEEGDRRQSSATLQQQVMNIKSDVSNAQTLLKTSEMRLKHNRSEFAKKDAQRKKTENESKKDNENLSKYEAEYNHSFEQLNKINYQEGAFEKLEDDYRSLRNEVNSIRHRFQGGEFARTSANIELKYDDPHPGFDRSKVYGAACKLFKVKDPKFNVALDGVAGGRLYNIVVENSSIGEKLLQNGRLQRRITLLPLDKMQGFVIPTQTLQLAEKLVGRGNVYRAIDLVEYEPKYKSAMEYIFGSCFVVKDNEVSKQLVKNHQTKNICVALDGDKLNPNGEVSGGAAIKTGSLLAQIQACLTERALLDKKQDELKEMEQQLKELEHLYQQYTNLKHTVDLRGSELEGIRDRLRATAHHRLAEDVRELQEQFEAINQEVKEAEATIKAGNKRLKDVEYKIANAKQIKEKELKAADADVKKQRSLLEAANAKWTDKESEEASIKLEIEGLEKSIEASKEKLTLSERAIQGFVDEIAKLSSSLEEIESAVSHAKAELKGQKDALAANAKEISSLNAQAEKIRKQKQDYELEIKKWNNETETLAGEARGYEQRLIHLSEEHPWLSEDIISFRENVYPDAQAAEELKDLKKLEAIKERLEREVNPRSIALLDQAQAQYEGVITKKKTVEADKKKIEQVIINLDEKKRQELLRACEKVSSDFGSIFSTLLPGAEAKLVPPSNMSVLDGLEVKVAFGGQWKDSLSELSGGQRSLVALSLVLAMLLFKPAPLYILDEVDAALDLSHTQNIGQMLRAHFNQSQFIVVSLKDGMFNNANVLFKTRFMDGMSTVTRTEISKSRSSHQ